MFLPLQTLARSSGQSLFFYSLEAFESNECEALEVLCSSVVKICAGLLTCLMQLLLPLWASPLQLNKTKNASAPTKRIHYIELHPAVAKSGQSHAATVSERLNGECGAHCTKGHCRPPAQHYRTIIIIIVEPLVEIHRALGRRRAGERQTTAACAATKHTP